MARLLGLGDRSATQTLHDLGKPKTGVGKAVEVVLALAAAVYDSPESQQGQVVAQSRLAHVKLVAQPPDMALSSESKLMTWSRVGSLTCFSRVAARCMVIARLASFVTLVAFVAFFILRIDVVIGICLQRSLTGQRKGDTPPTLPGVYGAS